MAENEAYLSAMEELGAGDLGRAEVLFEQALEVEPERPRIHANLGELHRRRGDLAAARESAERAVELGPEDAYGWRVLAGIHSDADDHTRARDAARRSVSLTEHPEVKAEATRTLAWSLINLEGWREAVSVLQAHLEASPKDVDAIDTLAVALCHGLYWGDALSLVKKARELRPEDEDLAEREDTVTQGLSEVGALLAQLRAEAETGGDWSAWHDLARTQLMTGQHGAALASFDEARQRHPDPVYRDPQQPAMLSPSEADARLGIPTWRPTAW